MTGTLQDAEASAVRERWHLPPGYEDAVQQRICACTDGQHLAQDMVAYVSSPFEPHPVIGIIADHDRVQVLERQLEQARELALDAINQGYESVELGGVFFDTMSALYKALTASPAQPTPVPPPGAAGNGMMRDNEEPAQPPGDAVIDEQERLYQAKGGGDHP